MTMLCMTLLRFDRGMYDVACVGDIVDRGGMKALVRLKELFHICVEGRRLLCSSWMGGAFELVLPRNVPELSVLTSFSEMRNLHAS